MKTLLSVAVALGLSVSAYARAGSLVDLKIVDRDTGAVLTPHFHDGRYFVAGVPGHRYGVQLDNRTGQRVLAVVSVDGVNVITGKTASPEQDGYVLDPYQQWRIDGWRKSMNEVAAFNFTALSSSYAAKTGRPDNVGVIGVAVFREKPTVYQEASEKITTRPATSDKIRRVEPSPPPPPASTPAPARETAAEPAGGADAARARADNVIADTKPKLQESLGTGHGEREHSAITYVDFERDSSTPSEIDTVWYDSYNNLVARGVIAQPRPIHRDPQPFPNSFVPDPAG